MGELSCKTLGLRTDSIMLKNKNNCKNFMEFSKSKRLSIDIDGIETSHKREDTLFKNDFLKFK